jgi:hypothetical protein
MALMPGASLAIHPTDGRPQMDQVAESERALRIHWAEPEQTLWWGIIYEFLKKQSTICAPCHDKCLAECFINQITMVI